MPLARFGLAGADGYLAQSQDDLELLGTLFPARPRELTPHPAYAFFARGRTTREAARAQLGLEAPLVRVEVYCGPGLPQVNIVGLAETAVRESRDRVQAALVNSGFTFPDGRVTINLAPADLPKEGGRYDLAIALGMLVASGQLPPGALDATEFYGELSLSGQLRPVPGLLVAAVQASHDGHRLVVPQASAPEARLAPRVAVCGVPDLLRLAAALAGRTRLPFDGPSPLPEEVWRGPDLADVRGQQAARRALEVAAAAPGADRRSVRLTIPGLVPCDQLKATLDLKDAGGEAFQQEFHQTIHRIPEKP